MADVDKRAARREVRTRRRFARRQWARRWVSLRKVLIGLLILALIATGVWLIFFSSVLSVKKVEVSGTQLLTAERVRSVSGIVSGEQLAWVDLDTATKRVGSLPEVLSVDITRHWPDAVRIEVTERTAVAVVDLGGTLRGLDEEGVIFREYKKAPLNLPRVRPTTSTGTDALKEAAQVVGALPQELAARVDHVEVETIDQISLFLRSGREVRWGSAEQSDQKAEVLQVLLKVNAQVYDVSVPGSPTTSGTPR